MAGLFALSINPDAYKNNFLEELSWGTFYQQHLGEEYSGLSVYNPERKKIKTWIYHGLFRSAFNFNNNDLKEFNGTEGIGYCGEDVEPYFIKDLIKAIGLPTERLCLDCVLLEPLKQKTLF